MHVVFPGGGFCRLLLKAGAIDKLDGARFTQGPRRLAMVDGGAIYSSAAS
jgi:hypothetical protein